MGSVRIAASKRSAVNKARPEEHSPSASTRRRLVQGLALMSCAAGSVWRSAVQALDVGGGATVLHGDQIDLVIAPLAFDVAGRPRVATAVNGSIPGPILRLQQGDMATIRVTNRLAETTSIHWHGLRLPADQDGVPGLTFRGIAPGETFCYRFPVRQGGTYWYHSHSGMQEQTGLYGALILVPREPEPYAYQRDYVVMLSDWTDEDPMTVLSNLKQQGDYYNLQRRTSAGAIEDARHNGFGRMLQERLLWGRLRMSPADIMDVGGATYTFLVNGQPGSANWSALFEPGDKVRLRFINGSSMTTFDVRVPGLTLTVIAADGNDVEPVVVDEFRIGVAETYDVIVKPDRNAAYTIFAQAQDRSGYVRGTLAPRLGMTAAVPPMDARPLRTMADMGMDLSDTGMSDMDMAHMDMRSSAATNADGVDAITLKGGIDVDNVAMRPRNRLGEAGDGLDGSGRRVLVYTDLKALKPEADTRAPEREIEFHLTGNMERWVWGFDGKKFSEAGPIRIRLGERVRFVLINDTMMEHPIHLHGFLFSVENGQQGSLPLKHTINVKPGERMSFVFNADTPGHWAFHCHLLYHMEAGMFRTVIVA
jgi:CopA family copper-resistance protein